MVTWMFEVQSRFSVPPLQSSSIQRSRRRVNCTVDVAGISQTANVPTNNSRITLSFHPGYACYACL